MVRLICLLLLVIGGSPGHADGSCNLPDSVWVTFPERGSLREDTYNRSLSTEAPSEVANLFGRQSTGKVGNFLLRDHFTLWMAAVGGGGLVFAGLWLRKP